jgi:glycosyltransferase involved in cell wall biosynthesis
MESRSTGQDLAAERRVTVSVVVPVYGCSGTLQLLHERLSKVLPELVSDYEVIYVDDRALDGSWRILRELAARDPHVIACQLSRNFGQQIAITAGLEQCRGEYVVVMDCDLQDPPEIIGKLLATAQGGFDIVFAKRKSAYRSTLRGVAGRQYFRLLSFLTGSKFDEELGAFSIISRRVVKAFLTFHERDRHYLMILYWLGFEATTIEYDREIRSIGESSYSLKKLIVMGLSGIFFSTTKLLTWVIYGGFILAAAGILLSIYYIISWFVNGSAPGWTSLIVVQLVVGGLVILSVGITALYIGKIFEASKQRPLYVMQDRIGGRELAESKPLGPEARMTKP